jgi:hypothetical protein
MDQDDPEKRIADPEDQLAEPHGVKRLIIWAVLVTIGFVWLLNFLFAAYDSYVYFVGTPTTATMGQCTQGFHLGARHNGGARNRGAGQEYLRSRVPNAVLFRKEGCTGTWSVDGASHSGRIVGGDIYRNYLPGDSVDVRVHDGRAYTTNSLENGLGILIFLGVVPVAVLAMFAVYVVWSSRRTDE